MRGLADDVGSRLETVATRFGRGARTCAVNSFLAATLVLTPTGLIPIGSLHVGDEVVAFNETTGTSGAYPVTVVHRTDDPVTGTVVIDGEPIGTTPHHPFFTAEHGWIDAAELTAGDHVPSATSSPGVVEAVSFAGGAATMFNLTVATAHTFYVGEGSWLVHNCGGEPGGARGGAASRRIIGENVEGRVKPAGEYFDAKPYRPRNWDPTDLRSMARRNARWARDVRRAGAEVIDIGRDPKRLVRRQPDFYGIEDNIFRGYSNRVRRSWPPTS